MAFYIDGKKVIGTNPTYTFTLLPIADNLYDVGSASYSYRQAHFQTAIYATSVVGNWDPATDDQYWVGGTTLGWKGFHMPDTLITDDTGYVLIRNNANNAYLGIKALDAFFTGKVDIGVFGDGSGVSTGTTGDVVGIYPEVPSGTTISDTAMGLRTRFLINAAQTADCSLYAIQGQLRVKANLADGVHAGLFGYFEQSGTVTLSESAGGYNAAVSAGVETGGTFTLGSGAVLAGVLISSVGLDAGTYTGNYDAIHILKATGREIWQIGINITAGAATLPFKAFNVAGDAYVSLDSGDDAVAGNKGIAFYAAADEDVELINLTNTTGTPRMHWDEANNRFEFSTGILVGAASIFSNDVVINGGSLSVAESVWSKLELTSAGNFYIGDGADIRITYQFNDADAKFFLCTMDESDDSGNNVPVFAFAEETNTIGADLGLFDAFVQPLVTVIDNDADSWFGITMTADDTAALAIGGNASNTGIAIQGTTGVVQRMAYAQILEILGDCSGFYPFTDATGTTVTDFTANGQDGTPSKDIGTWDITPAYQGSVQVYDFDGDDEEFDVADDVLFSTATAFSIGAAVKMTVGTDSTIIAVWDVDNTFREFRLYLDANGYPSFECYDESGDDAIGREDQTAIGTGSWHTIFGVMDGGTDAANLTIYKDGLAVDDADIVDDASFADIEDTGAALMIGHIISSGVAELHDGKMWGSFYTKKELSADEAWNLHQIYRGLLNF